MHWEVEQKFRIVGESVVQTLAEMGVQFGEGVRQIDRYFNHPGRDFAVTDEALRIRQVAEQNFVTYKGPKFDLASKTRQEVELQLADGAETAQYFGEILKSLGFQAAGTVVKTRRVGHLRPVGSLVEVELALDDVEQLGTFLEMEVQADDQHLAASQGELTLLAGQLGLKDCERRSYLELLTAEIS